MGADLYIRSVTDAAKNPDEGYFRDSYNGTSLLWTLNLSWWADVKLNSAGFLAGNYLLRFRKQVAEAQMVDIDEAYLRKAHCSLEGENTVESSAEQGGAS